MHQRSNGSMNRLWFLDISTGLQAPSPKAEGRNSKEIRSPKPEVIAPFAAVGADGPEAPRRTNLNSSGPRGPPAESGPFGIRISALLRPSAFGFRISLAKP